MAHPKRALGRPSTGGGKISLFTRCDAYDISNLMAPTSRSFSPGSMGLHLGATTLVFVASAALSIGCKDAAPTPSPEQGQTRPEAVNAEPKAAAPEGAQAAV